MRFLRTTTLAILLGLGLYGFLRPEVASAHLRRVKHEIVRLVKE